MKKVLIFISAFIIFSCKDKIKELPAPAEELFPILINKYNTVYMQYPADSPLPGPAIATLEYDSKGKVIKRFGGLIPINPNTGYNYIYSNGVYDEVFYSPNEIKCIQKDTLAAFNVNPDPKIIILENGRIRKIIKEFKWYTTTYDTTDFYYTNNLLDSTVQYNSREIITRKFQFNTSQNLISINGVSKNRSDHSLNYTSQEKLEDYDNAENPTKYLFMLDETFIRSLSKNNFRKYTYRKYNLLGYAYVTIDKAWNLKYDDNGKVIFE